MTDTTREWDLDTDLLCGTCGGKLGEPGQWLRCRAHYTAEIERLRKLLEGDSMVQENRRVCAERDRTAKVCDELGARLRAKEAELDQHKFRDESLAELNDILDFLEEWSRERREFGGF